MTEPDGSHIQGADNSDFLRRVVALLRHGLRRYRGRASAAVLAGLLGTATQAGALLSIVPILRRIDPAREPGNWGVSVQHLGFIEYTVYVLGVALLFAISVHMKYRVFSMAYGLSENVTVDCAESAVEALRVKLRNEKPGRPQLKKLINQALVAASSSCGVLFRHVLLALNEAVLLLVFTCILFYLSPLATAVVAILSVPPIVVYLRSYRKIAVQADKATEHRKQSRNETGELLEALQDNTATADEIRTVVRALYHRGETGQALSGQISMRRQMRGSGAFVELLTPIGIVVIALLAYFADTLELDLVMILAYYLILRQAIAAATQVADGLVMVNRVYPGLRNYVRIVDPDAPLNDVPANRAANGTSEPHG